MVKPLFLIPMTHESEGLLIYAKNAVEYPELHKMHLFVFIGLNGGQ